MYINGSPNTSLLLFTSKKRKRAAANTDALKPVTRSSARKDTYNSRGAFDKPQDAVPSASSKLQGVEDDTPAVNAALFRLSLTRRGSDEARKQTARFLEYHHYNSAGSRQHYLKHADLEKEALVPLLDGGYLDSHFSLTPDSIYEKLQALKTDEGNTGREAICNLYRYAQNPDRYKIRKQYQKLLLSKGLIRPSLVQGAVIVPEPVKEFVRERVQVEDFSQVITVKPPIGPIPTDDVFRIYKFDQPNPWMTFDILEELYFSPSVQGRNAIKALHALVKNNPDKKLLPVIKDLLISKALVKAHPTQPSKVIVSPYIQADISNMVSISDYDDITLIPPKREERAAMQQDSRRLREHKQ